MEVSNRIVIFSRGRLEQIGSPREIYELPRNEFVARFIGVMNVLELRVTKGMARLNELSFPAHGASEGQTIRVGFRPYAVQISGNTGEFRYQAEIKHIYFLGVMLRVELETPEGLVIRARISKEDFARYNVGEGDLVSFQIRNYRVLAREGESLDPEVSTVHSAPDFDAGI